jgi:hypothetical protein
MLALSWVFLGQSLTILQYIAQKLLNINENGTFVFPPLQDEKARLVQDDEIFNRARLVNCGFFLQIILGGIIVSFRDNKLRI